MDLTEIPFNRFIGLERSPREGFLFQLPAADHYQNHLGTLHAGALMALAEASSGEVMLEAIGHLGDPIIPVVRRFESKFRRPATGCVATRASLTAGERERLLSDLSGKGRGTVAIAVEVVDEQDLVCVTATVEWFVSRRS
jgi:acyl-coenzyme A thioesterase PaaI-like protein